MALVPMARDWSFVPYAPPALVYIIEPLGNRAALVAEFLLPRCEQCPYQRNCEDSARKEDDPFPPLRHNAEMMDVFHA